jgi:hypothetical protein
VSVDLDLDGDEGDVSDGLTALVIAVVEILVEALEAEAVRRMESGELADAEVERLGEQLLAIESEIDSLKRTAGVAEATDDLRGQLDGVVREALVDLDARTGRGGGAGADAAAGDVPRRRDDGGDGDDTGGSLR